jgi:hypothetical protein
MNSIVKELNQSIIDAHNKHYECSKTGLINPNESPNGNLIYHLYSDGEITYQKGGWAYLERSEFTSHYSIPGCEKFGFKFVNDNSDKTYVILNENECIEFRNKMAELIKKID